MPIKKKLPIPVFFLIESILILNLIFFAYGCNGPDVNKSSSGHSEMPYEYIKDSNQDFVGVITCKTCHNTAYGKWGKSDHYHAMAVANAKNVLGNFNNIIFKHKGITYRFYKKNGNYMVRTMGPDGKYHAYKIVYTFGWIPLQQYLIRFPRGKYQALTVAWDTKKKRWFSLYPHIEIKTDDFLFWTKGAMNWNTMCADCHSTNLRQNYVVKSDSFHTTWSGINVSCESCHGPGKKHVDYIRSLHGNKPNMKIVRQSLKMTVGTSSYKLVDECARCHSRREQITKAYNFRGTFLDHYDPDLPHPPNYYADGQIKNEDYVYGSFMQSKMYHVGIACTNCHDSHTYHLIATGNKLCIRCHSKLQFNSVAHTHHKMNTAAAKCVNCHMTGKDYMQVDFRRDHSFRIPGPDISVKFGPPNACNNCHSDKSAKWAALTIKKWYGSPTSKDHFFSFTQILAKASKGGPNAESELLQLVKDTTQPAIARATAIWYLSQFPDKQSVNVMRIALHSGKGLIRISAVKALYNLSPSIRDQMLKPMIMDSIRTVRITAAMGLADLQKSDFSVTEQSAYGKVNKELEESFEVTQYFPAGQFNQGEYYERKKKWNKAVTAYQKAIAKNPRFNEARLNLADLYNQLGQNDKAEKLLKTVIKQEPDFGPTYYSLALLTAQEGKLKESLAYFNKATKQMPDNARVYYNWAIVLQKLKQYRYSEIKYLRAINIDPNNTEYQYGIITLYLQQNNFKTALSHAKKLIELQPNNREYQELIQVIKSKIDFLSVNITSWYTTKGVNNSVITWLNGQNGCSKSL